MMEYVETSSQIASSLAEDEVNTARAMKDHLVTVLDETANTGEYVDTSYSTNFALILFVIVIVIGLYVFRKYYMAKKSHML